ncbi:MAG: isopentenyl-diphosphate delta-isomerase, partial [Betaproteobacteria bacterium]|nr:isopentenyl-diphosphate delta-isomerase [Betaproteobacteria bacterium]
MGFDTELQNAFEFIYRADLDKGLIEHEYDHVFVGNYSRPFVPNEQEVEDWKYIGLPELKAEIVHKPELFTPWFKIAFERLVTSGNE